MDDRSPSMLKATLIGGGVFGLIGGLPIIGALNCACCSLVIAGGFVAAYLYSRACLTAGAGFAAGNGALVGLVAGLFYAIGNSIVGLIQRAIWGPPNLEQMLEQFESKDVPPEAVELMNRVVEMFSSPGSFVLIFFITLLMAAVFSTLGGLIGGAVFKVSPPPPAPTGAGPDTV